MRLVIQIPCFNECRDLPRTMAELPRALPGIDEIIVVVIDDGSTDGTSEVAERCGAHFIVRFSQNRGLAAAYSAGMETCYRLEADVVVNTDADNQYFGGDVRRLVEPILSGEADLVVGDRQTDRLQHFSGPKKLLQRWGTRMVRRLARVHVNDATSGFRALNHRAVEMQFVHNGFSYTLESLIHAGVHGLSVVSVPVRVNAPTRPSRLFRSLSHYLYLSIPVIIKSYLAYWPGRTFSAVASVFGIFGLLGVGRFAAHYVADPTYNGHIQALMAGLFCLTVAVLSGLVAGLGELLAVNRRLIEVTLGRIREIDAREAKLRDIPQGECRAGVYRTCAEFWLPAHHCSSGRGS